MKVGRVIWMLAAGGALLIVFCCWLFGMYLNRPLFYNYFDGLSWHDVPPPILDVLGRYVEWDFRANMVAVIQNEPGPLQSYGGSGFLMVTISGTTVRIVERPNELVRVDSLGVHSVRALKPGEAKSIQEFFWAYERAHPGEDVKLYEAIVALETGGPLPAK